MVSGDGNDLYTQFQAQFGHGCVMLPDGFGTDHAVACQKPHLNALPPDRRIQFFREIPLVFGIAPCTHGHSEVWSNFTVFLLFCRIMVNCSKFRHKCKRQQPMYFRKFGCLFMKNSNILKYFSYGFLKTFWYNLQKKKPVFCQNPIFRRIPWKPRTRNSKY